MVRPLGPYICKTLVLYDSWVFGLSGLTTFGGYGSCGNDSSGGCGSSSSSGDGVNGASNELAS